MHIGSITDEAETFTGWIKDDPCGMPLVFRLYPLKEPEVEKKH